MEIIKEEKNGEGKIDLENTTENINREILTEKEQKSFIDTTIGKTINTAINLGIRFLLPNLIEDEVIEIKDTIIKEGFKEGLDKAIESAIDIGKSAMGIVTGKFDNISQIQTAVEKGGLIDTISNGIDFGLNVANQSGLIPKDVASMIKKGKNLLVDNIESNIQDTLTEQIKSIEKIDIYIGNWIKCYKIKDFDTMQLEYDKIREKLKEVIPIEDTLKRAHQVENLHKLIKSNGKNFDISQEEINLAKKLI